MSFNSSARATTPEETLLTTPVSWGRISAFSQSSVLFTDSRLGSMSELSHCSTDWAREL